LDGKRSKVCDVYDNLKPKINVKISYRVQDNWAMLFTQKLALKNKLPLHVIFCLTDNFLGATLRHYKFMLDGLEEVAEDLRKLSISFHLLRGEHKTEIPKFV
jgi:deoxyribodipyrimidine photo-lyase